jgi:two-component system response regulator HydG
MTLERILIVDDDRALAETLSDGLADLGYDAVPVTSSDVGLHRLGEDFAVLVTDLRMPGTDGLGLLTASKRVAPERPVIVMTAYSAVDSAIESIRQGAFHYLTKPFKVQELALFVGRSLEDVRLRRETRTLRRTVREGQSLDRLVGAGAAMREVASVVRRIADTSVPVLLLGETGTGKGLVARALHGEGARASGPFVTVNCAALPEPLLESELFGHARGSFTGAVGERRGLFEEASGGTLFLDEIGELALPLQAKLLDVLERGVVRPLGSNKERVVDARIVAATHRDLAARVARGEFRDDLLFRLDVVTVEVPALRHRRDDIPELTAHFLEVGRKKHPRAVGERFSAEAMLCLQRHTWPGNVRELEHLVERSLLLGSHAVIEVGELPRALQEAPERPAALSGPSFTGSVLPLAEVQRRYAAWALEQLGGRKMITAEKLDVDRKTLAKLLALTADEIEK